MEIDTDRCSYDAQLLPCPFCGSRAYVYVTGTGLEVCCKRCSCVKTLRVSGRATSDCDIRRAVKSWNKRKV